MNPKMAPGQRTDTMPLVSINDEVYEAVREFGPDANGVERVIVLFGGLYAFAYRTPGEQSWRLADADSPPAPPEQVAVLEQLVAASGTLDNTVVDVEPPGRTDPASGD